MARSQRDILNLDDDKLTLLYVFMSFGQLNNKKELKFWGGRYLKLMDGDDEAEEHISYLKAIHYRERVRNSREAISIIESELKRRELL